MRNIIFLVALVSVGYACKSKKKTSDEPTTADNGAKITGTVSHAQKANGCTAVIQVEGEEAMTLIPKDGLGEFDVDGLKITFNYHPLKMPNRQGCEGIMAEITGIAKK